MRFVSMPKADPAPVFSDRTGRRQRRLRWASYGLVAAGATFLVMAGISIVGGSGMPRLLLPVPDLVNGQDEKPAPQVVVSRPAVTPPADPVPVRDRSDDARPDRVVDGPRPTVSPAGTAPTAPPAAPTARPTGGPAPTGPAQPGIPPVPVTPSAEPPASSSPPPGGLEPDPNEDAA